LGVAGRTEVRALGEGPLNRPAAGGDGSFGEAAVVSPSASPRRQPLQGQRPPRPDQSSRVTTAVGVVRQT